MKKSLLTLLPLVVFVALALLFADRLAHPRAGGSIDSPLVGQPLPTLSVTLPKDIKGAYVINFFASWCTPCAVEHPLLMQLHKNGMRIIGIAYKDTPDAIKNYLGLGGNPYSDVLYDTDGTSGIALGINGVPESFAVGAGGIVAAHHRGPFENAADMDAFAGKAAP